MSKISILINSLAGGGAERVASILLTNLKEKKYDVTLILMSSIIIYDIPSDIKIIYLEKGDSESGLFKLLKLPFLGYRYKKICKKK